MSAILSSLEDFGEPRTKIVAVGPELARKWLDRNMGNRPVSVATVVRYAEEMSKGRWKMTGDPVRFSTTGKLIDGQHRLHAVIKSGVTINVLVITDLQDSIFNVIDTGRGRGKADILSIEYGLPFETTKLLASAATIAYFYEHGAYSLKGALSHEDLAEHVRANPRLISSAQYVHDNVPRLSPAPKSIAAAFFFFASGLEEARAKMFVERFMVGTVLDANDNLLHLRNQCFNARAVRRPMQASDVFGRLVRIWNSERRGKPIKHYGNVSLREGEPYPQII